LNTQHHVAANNTARLEGRSDNIIFLKGHEAGMLSAQQMAPEGGNPDSSKRAAWAGVKLPEGYSLDEVGVLDTEGKLIAGPVWVTALASNEEKTRWSVVVCWLDHDGEQQEWAIPSERFHDSGRGVAKELATKGLRVTPGQEGKLLQYLTAFTPLDRSLFASKVGWLEAKAIYVLPNDRVYGAETAGYQKIILASEQHQPGLDSIRIQGSLKEWQIHVAEPCRGNPVLMFSLCAAFAGPLLKILNLESGGFHFHGLTSRGKTTALQVAASVWGCGADPAGGAHTNSFITRWNATSNGLEGMASAHNDNLLLLDEIGTSKVDDFGRQIYDLLGGKGKSAMDANRNLRETSTWRTVVLSTGELSARAMIEGGRKAAKGGQLIRLIDLPVGDRVIADNKGQDTGRFVDQLKTACSRYYGCAIEAYLTKLVRLDRKKIEEFFKELESKLCNKVGSLTPEQCRVIKRFALVLTAGLLAREFGVLRVELRELWLSIVEMLNVWLKENAPDLSDSARCIEALQNFLVTHRRRFETLSATASDKTKSKLVGYSDHGRGLYLLTKGTMEEACRGFDVKTACSELKKRGWLFQNDKDRSMSKHSIPGGGRASFYAIKMDILNATD
jgi:putative DNA primase/helicase